MRHALAALLVATAATVLLAGLGPTSAGAEVTESTPVTLTPEQLRDSVYAAVVAPALIGPQPQGQSAPNGAAIIWKTALVEKLDEIHPISSTGASELQALLAHINVVEDRSAPETQGHLLKTLNRIAKQVGESGSKFAEKESLKKAMKAIITEALQKVDATRPGTFDPAWFRYSPTVQTQAIDVLERDASLSGNANFEQVAQQLLPAGEPALDAPMSTLVSHAPAVIANDANQLAAGASEGVVDNDWQQAVHQMEQTAQSEGVTISSMSSGTTGIGQGQGQLAADQAAVRADLGAAGLATSSEQQAGNISTTIAKAELEADAGAAAAADLGADGVEELLAGPLGATLSAIDPITAVYAISQAPQIILSLVNLISGTPSTEEVIIKQLVVIQEMIEELSKQVSKSLSIVDANLLTLNVTLQEDTLLLKNVVAHIGRVTNDVAQIEEKLDQIQANLWEIAKTQREETLVADLDTDIGYSERTPGRTPMPLYQFEQAAGTFFAWGTYDPSDALSELPSADWAALPSEVFSQLGSSSSSDALNFNLDYLAFRADEWGEGLEPSPALPNPEVWADGANAFAQLLMENPEYLTEPMYAKLGEVAEVGASLPEELAKLGQRGCGQPECPQSADGLTFETGSSVLNHALANYVKSGVDPEEPSLLNGIEAEENYFLSQQNPGHEDDPSCTHCELGIEPGHVLGDTGRALINIWGGAEQHPEQAPPEELLTPFQSTSSGAIAEEQNTRTPDAINVCGPGEATFLTTKEVKPEQVAMSTSETIELLPNELLDPLPSVYANAWHLGLGYISTCYAAEYIPGEKYLRVELDWYWHDNASKAKRLALRLIVGEGKVPECAENADVIFRKTWVPNECHGIFGGGGHNAELNELASLLLTAKGFEEGFNGHKWWPSEEFSGEQCVKELKELVLFACRIEFPSPAEVGVSKEVEKTLASMRLQVYNDIAPPEQPNLNAANEDVHRAAARLNGARALLDDYIELALPETIARDPHLATLVFEPPAILKFEPPERSEIADNSPGKYEIFTYFTSEIEAAEKRAAEGTGPPVGDPAAAGGPLAQKIEKHASELASELTPDIAEMQQAGGGQTDPLILATQARLELTEMALAPEEAPAVVKQPVATTVPESATATFIAEAAGEPTPEVQWEVSSNGGVTFSADTADPGNRTGTLHIEATKLSESGHEYRAHFQNKVGTATSLAAVLTVKQEAPKITKQPQSAVVVEGQGATFVAEASGAPAPSVKWEVRSAAGLWHVDSVDPGATTDALHVEGAASSQGGSKYRARFENARGSVTTSFVTLTVKRATEAPRITREPASASVKQTRTATFTAQASGEPAPTVQWEVSTNHGASYSIDLSDPGNTTGTLKVENVTLADNGHRYRARFENGAGTLTTLGATLTVTK